MAQSHLEASGFIHDAEALHGAVFSGVQLDAAAEYLTLRQAYVDLQRKGEHAQADVLARVTPRLFHHLAREGLLAAPGIA
ncbi:MAG: hypothetical protein ABWZ40_14565 [Caulobacterales bacterium]